MEKEGWLFLCGCAPFLDLVFCAREKEELADENVVASAFYAWDEQKSDPDKRWMVYNMVVNWRAQGIATIKPHGSIRTTVAIGSHGQYFEVEPESLTKSEGAIKKSSIILRCIASVDNVIFAAGMGRSVFIRESLGEWREFGPGNSGSDGDRIIGFEAIDGFAPDNLIAVGWQGEIWSYSEGKWTQITSPTNTNLNAVSCAPDGTVYSVGDNGIMVIGKGDQWEVVDTGRSENLQAVSDFADEVFVATDFRILKLTDDGLVSEQRFQDGDEPATCLSLFKTEGGLMAMGPKDLFRFSDGIWNRII
ncbi:MAG: hypothetical protein AB2598_10415 [Candidatus Thiodiazotropha sp.]